MPLCCNPKRRGPKRGCVIVRPRPPSTPLAIFVPSYQIAQTPKHPGSPTFICQLTRLDDGRSMVSMPARLCLFLTRARWKTAAGFAPADGAPTPRSAPTPALRAVQELGSQSHLVCKADVSVKILRVCGVRRLWGGSPPSFEIDRVEFASKRARADLRRALRQAPETTRGTPHI